MGLFKRVWHDPVWSKVIAALICYGGAEVVRHWPSGLLASANRWFAVQVTLTRGDLVRWPLQTVSGILAFYAGVLGIRFHITQRRSRLQAEPQVDAQPEGHVAPKASLRFEPEKFELTGPRCRALIGLLQRVDARTTLHDLYQFVVTVGLFVDTSTTKGQLQHDMEEAERSGIVAVERVSSHTELYSLTIPAGRDWVLSNEKELRTRLSWGMQLSDTRSSRR